MAGANSSITSRDESLQKCHPLFHSTQGREDYTVR